MASPLSPAEQGRALVEQINRRPGDTEFRVVRLHLGRPGQSEATPNKTYRIGTLRSRSGSQCRTAFCVLGPWPLTGTSYLLQEHLEQVEPFGISLYLPFGLRKIMQVDAARRGQAQLGSDFAYDDLKYWLPLDRVAYTYCGHEETSQGLCHVAEGQITDPRLSKALGYSRMRYWFQQPSQLAVRIEFADADQAEPFRTYTADRLCQIDSLWIPQRMQIINRRTRHESTLLLEQAWYHRPVADEWLTPQALPRLGRLMQDLQTG